MGLTLFMGCVSVQAQPGANTPILVLAGSCKPLFLMAPL